MTFVRFFLFAGVWTGLDFLFKHSSAQGLATPWYPQAAMALALVLLTGWRYVLWIPLAKMISSVSVWPGPLAERIFPAITFTIGICAIAAYIRSRLNQEQKTASQLLGEISAGTVLISLAQSVARVGYYSWLEGGDVGFVNSMLTSWLGDISSLLTITPALVLFATMLFYNKRPNRPWYTNPIISPFFPTAEQLRATLKKTSPYVFSILLFSGSLFFVTGDWHFRAWYLVIFPCFAMAIWHGLTGAILAVTAVELCLGILAMFHLPGQSVIEVQIFFLCMAFMILPLGAVTSERNIHIQRLTVGARLIIGAQLIKIRTLTEMGERLMGPLGDLQKTIDQGSMAAMAVPANQFLARFDTFLEDVQNFDPLANTLTPIRAAALKEALNADFPALEVKISQLAKSDSLGDEKLIGEVAHLLAQILANQKNRSSKKIQMEVEVRPDFIELSGYVRLSTGDFAVKDLDFVSLLKPPRWSLPPGGYPLTFYRINSLVQLAAGRFFVRPVYFSWSDRWVMRARIPLHGELA